MIQLGNLSKNDIGRWVEYCSPYSSEQGRIKSWNDKWVFVVYKCDDDWDNFKNYTGCATSPDELNFLKTKEIK